MAAARPQCGVAHFPCNSTHALKCSKRTSTSVGALSRRMVRAANSPRAAQPTIQQTWSSLSACKNWPPAPATQMQRWPAPATTNATLLQRRPDDITVLLNADFSHHRQTNSPHNTTAWTLIRTGCLAKPSRCHSRGFLRSSEPHTTTSQRNAHATPAGTEQKNRGTTPPPWVNHSTPAILFERSHPQRSWKRRSHAPLSQPLDPRCSRHKQNPPQPQRSETWSSFVADPL